MKWNLPGVGTREIIRRAPFFDGERLGAITSVQLLEAVHWDAGRSGNELQHARAHLRIEGQNHLQYRKAFSDSGPESSWAFIYLPSRTTGRRRGLRCSRPCSWCALSNRGRRWFRYRTWEARARFRRIFSTSTGGPDLWSHPKRRAFEPRLEKRIATESPNWSRSKKKKKKKKKMPRFQS